MPPSGGDHAPRKCFIGLISGTSMDGIDAVVATFEGKGIDILAGATIAFSPDLAHALHQARGQPEALDAARLAWLDGRLADELAGATDTIIDRAGLTTADIVAVGCHGQTLFHRPDAEVPASVQLGDPWRIARHTGVPVVADFRRPDLAAGGQGAPLAPLLHHELLASPDEDRVVVNIGGIANLTGLPAAGGVSGFDSGPGNCLLDDWYRRHHDRPFDSGGRLAAGGRVDDDWLQRLLAEPYFDRPPPKSTGIEYFSPDWLDRHLPPDAADRPADIQATLAELTALGIVRAIPLVFEHRRARVLVCGGGVHNAHLLARLRHHLPDTVCESTARRGLGPDHVEAALFAWLARERMAGRRVDTGPVTGARSAIVPGAIFRP